MFIGPLLLLVVSPALRRIFLARDQENVATDRDAVMAVEGNPDG
jgi:hypothetical protein